MTTLYAMLPLWVHEWQVRETMAAKYMQQSATARAVGDEQLAARYALRAADYLVG